MKKYAIPNRKVLEEKDLRWKKGNPKTQGARKERHPKKKEATPKYKGLEKKDIRWKKRQPQNARG
jgi:hypothetical protein